MTETPTDDPMVRVTRDLTAILDLAAKLRVQAVRRHSDKDMPGGRAMVEIAPIASPEAWRNHQETLERLWWDDDDVPMEARPDAYADEVEEDAPVLQILLFWSEDWRRIHAKESDLRPTVQSEAAFIRGCLDWAWECELHWKDFAADLSDARRRLENTLSAGHRDERTRVPCMVCGARLVKRYADRVKYDHWWCPNRQCPRGNPVSEGRRYERDEYIRAKHVHLASENTDRYVLVPDAIAAVKPDRPEHTVRTWIKRMQVRRICDLKTRQIMVYWPDVRKLNDDAKRRKAKRDA